MVVNGNSAESARGSQSRKLNVVVARYSRLPSNRDECSFSAKINTRMNIKNISCRPVEKKYSTAVNIIDANRNRVNRLNSDVNWNSCLIDVQLNRLFFWQFNCHSGPPSRVCSALGVYGFSSRPIHFYFVIKN